MTKNDKLRGLEIRFYLVLADLVKLTKVHSLQNAYAFFDFLEVIDFTKSINYDILKTLTERVYNENTGVQPNKIELCNFAYTHKIPIKFLKKYTSISTKDYDVVVSLKKEQKFYQPIHLQPQVYNTIEAFLNLTNTLLNLGVEKQYARVKDK